MPTRIRPFLCIAAVCLFGTPLFAQNHKIDFEDFAGPSRFDAVQAPARVQSATISGGQVLRNTMIGATVRSSVYGTSYKCSGCSPEISIQFHHRVANVQISYQSEQSVEVRYQTEDQQGNLQETTLPETLSAGSGTVVLPYQNIRQVTLANTSPDFELSVNAVTFAATSGPVLIDPVVAGLLSGSSITTNVNSIAAATTGLVQGVAADGTAQTVLRIPASSVGQAIHGRRDQRSRLGQQFRCERWRSDGIGREHFRQFRERDGRYDFSGCGSVRDLSRAGEFFARDCRQFLDHA